MDDRTQVLPRSLDATPLRSVRKAVLWTLVGVLALGTAIFVGHTVMTAIPSTVPNAMLTEATVFRDCETCPLMRVLAPATFEQGSSADDALSFEKPAHAVTIGYVIAAGVNEVSVGEFAEFAKEYPRERNGCATYGGDWRVRPEVSWRNATVQQNDMFPVTCVSWQDAADYASWLSLRTGQVYRLPTAAEWEYLARASEDRLPWSNLEDACQYTNAADNTAAQKYPGWTAFPCADGFVELAPVGTFAANTFGLNDTLGNAFEWTQDCWRNDYTTAPADGSGALDGNCGEREARGGSWFTTPAFVRPGYRNRFDAGYRSNSLGFRLIREIKAL